MKLYIEQCIDLYKKEFPCDWFSTYSWSPDSEKKSYRECHDKIHRCVNQYFVLISKSALSGEYVIKSNHVEKALNQLEELLANEYSLDSSSKLEKDIIDIYEKLDLELKSCVSYYRSLWSLVSTKVDEFEHDFIFNLSSINCNTTNKYLVFFNNIIIEICKKDHYLSYDKERISELFLLKEKARELFDSETDERVEEKNVLAVTLDKCSFLLKKMTLISGSSEYCYNYKNYRLNNNDIELNYTKEIYEKFNDLHGKKISETKVLDIQKECINGNAKISHIILLMKSYQKDHGTIKQINNLINQFDTIYKRLYEAALESKRVFEIHALNTVKNYLYNCRFSFKLDSKGYSYENLCDDMREIQEIQKETKIKNFYPYRKAIQFLKKDISESFKKDYSDEFRTLIEHKISILDEYLGNFKDSLTWAKEQHFYPFQLLSNECRIKVNSLNFKIFIPSSFSKPIDYEPLFQDLNEYKTALESYKSKIEIFEEKSRVESLKIEISQSGKKNIEFLAIFIAIITFLFGSISSFLQCKSNGEFIKLACSLGYILLLFVSSIFFYTLPYQQKKKDYFKEPKIYFFIIITISCLSYLILGIIKEYLK